MKIKATSRWADCWHLGDIFEVHTNAEGHAYIRCHDIENGPEHAVDNGGETDLTPSDILTGKSTQFICIEV